MNIIPAKGEGQGTCKLCKARKWMIFLYRIEGTPGLFCEKCINGLKEREKWVNEI